MRKFSLVALLVALPVALASTGVRGQQTQVPSAGGAPDRAIVHADVVASGIPGAGAITQIGTFHTGGPFHDKAAFAAETQPGHVSRAPGCSSRAPRTSARRSRCRNRKDRSSRST